MLVQCAVCLSVLLVALIDISWAVWYATQPLLFIAKYQVEPKNKETTDLVRVNDSALQDGNDGMFQSLTGTASPRRIFFLFFCNGHSSCACRTCLASSYLASGFRPSRSAVLAAAAASAAGQMESPCYTTSDLPSPRACFFFSKKVTPAVESRTGIEVSSEWSRHKPHVEIPTGLTFASQGAFACSCLQKTKNSGEQLLGFQRTGLIGS